MNSSDSLAKTGFARPSDAEPSASLAEGARLASSVDPWPGWLCWLCWLAALWRGAHGLWRLCRLCWDCWRLRKVWRRSGAMGWSTLIMACLALLGVREACSACAARRSLALRPNRPAFCDFFEASLEEPVKEPVDG